MRPYSPIIYDQCSNHDRWLRPLRVSLIQWYIHSLCGLMESASKSVRFCKADQRLNQVRFPVFKSRSDEPLAPHRSDAASPTYQLEVTVGADNMAEKLAEALRERREAVERIIRKVESLDQGEKPSPDLAPSSQVASAKSNLAGITNFEDVLKWAKQNFEPSDVLLLET